MIDYTLLYYFQQVAKYESITQAAEVVHISQPNLSNAIVRLEKEIGISLFTHRRGRIQLNDMGATLKTYVDRAFSILDDGQKVITEMVSERARSLAIGYSIYFDGDDFLEKFRKKSNDIVSDARLKYFLFDNESIQSKLLSGEIDIALSLQPPHTKDITWVPVTTTYICAIVSKNNRLAGRKHIRLQDLVKENFICRLGGVDRYMTTALCRRADFFPNIVFESSDHSLVGRWIEDNIGVSLVTTFDVVELIDRQEHIQELSVLCLDDNQFALPLGLSYNPKRHALAVVKGLIDFGIKHFEDLGNTRNARWDEFCKTNG